MTPSALDKGRMKAKQIVILTMDGENLTPDLKPTSEKDMHIGENRSGTDDDQSQGRQGCFREQPDFFFFIK